MLPNKERWIVVQDGLVADFEDRHGRPPDVQELRMICRRTDDIVADEAADAIDRAYDDSREGG